jgi:hypothetical protein
MCTYSTSESQCDHPLDSVLIARVFASSIWYHSVPISIKYTSYLLKYVRWMVPTTARSKEEQARRTQSTPCPAARHARFYDSLLTNLFLQSHGVTQRRSTFVSSWMAAADCGLLLGAVCGRRDFFPSKKTAVIGCRCHFRATGSHRIQFRVGK